jgi:hypothetical protein
MCWRPGYSGPAAAWGSGVGEGEIGQQYGHVVVEPVAGVCAQPVHQLIGGRLRVGPAQTTSPPTRASADADR